MLPTKRVAPEPALAATANIHSPNALLMMLEGRAPWEMAAMRAALPWLRRLLPRRDGHPVLVFPGLGANDFTTVPLRNFLDGLGYVTKSWGQGLNFGPRDGVLQRCAADVRQLAQKHGQPVSLIGWSLGGLFAGEMAKELPRATRCVVTLGTPFAGHPRATNAWRVFELLSGQSAHDPAMIEKLRTTPASPTTSIYSKTDGVVAWRGVAWQCSVKPLGPCAENIEVQSSHCGMGMNPLALYAISDRLVQPVDAWQPFDPAGKRKWFYRTGTANT